MQHVAGCTAAAHFGDLVAGLHALPFIDQTRAVVAIGRQPLLAVFDDDEFTVADKTGAGIHHYAVGGGAYRRAAFAGDIDTLSDRKSVV